MFTFNRNNGSSATCPTATLAGGTNDGGMAQLL